MPQPYDAIGKSINPKYHLRYAITASHNRMSRNCTVGWWGVWGDSFTPQTPRSLLRKITRLISDCIYVTPRYFTASRYRFVLYCINKSPFYQRPLPELRKGIRTEAPCFPTVSLLPRRCIYFAFQLLGPFLRSAAFYFPELIRPAPCGIMIFDLL